MAISNTFYFLEKKSIYFNQEKLHYILNLSIYLFTTLDDSNQTKQESSKKKRFETYKLLKKTRITALLRSSKFC